MALRISSGNVVIAPCDLLRSGAIREQNDFRSSSGNLVIADAIRAFEWKHTFPSEMM